MKGGELSLHGVLLTDSWAPSYRFFTHWDISMQNPPLSQATKVTLGTHPLPPTKLWNLMPYIFPAKQTEAEGCHGDWWRPRGGAGGSKRGG